MSSFGDLNKTKKTALSLATFAVFMVGVAYAAVPLYELFCRVTGFGGTTQVADVAPAEILDQTIKVRFDGNVAAGVPWDLEPGEVEVEVQLGAIHETFYTATSIAQLPTWGTATFNVSPPQVGAYFNKMHCFCFELQELAGGESMDMGVVFFVDPAILNDPVAANVDTITLSYTMFSADAPIVEDDPSELSAISQ
ncbi:MAG: cytochrome c oxidase assembly protein [Pseudomonadota bacterium]